MKDLSAFIKQQQELKIKTIQNTNSILRMQIGIQILLGLILVAWILTTWLLFDMLLGQIVGTISSMIVLIMISMRVILIAFEIRDNNYKNQTVICGEAAIKTDKLKDTKLEAFDKSTKKLDIHTVQITCIVLDTDIKEPIRNIAAITEYRAEDNKSKDSDSVHNNDLTNFKEDDHEDDEDYESPLDILFKRLEYREPNHIAIKYYKDYHSRCRKNTKINTSNISLKTRKV